MTLLITLQDFQNRVKISQNLKDKDINPSIIYAQEMHLDALLCGLYDIIIEQKQNCILEDRFIYLLDKYIKPYLVYVSYSDYLTAHNIQGTRQGLVEINGDNATGAEIKRIGDISRASDAKASAYEEKIRTFLESSEDYPEYNCPCSDNNMLFGFGFSSIGKDLNGNDLFV